MALSTASERGDTLLRTTLIPLFLILTAPPAVQFVWVICYHHAGDSYSAFHTPVDQLWHQFPKPSRPAAMIALSFLIAQLALLLFIPGPRFTAIPTPMGNRPVYKLNGVACFFITHAVLAAAAAMGYLPYGALYDHFGPLLAFLGKSALFGTVVLYLRGIFYPTNSDSGTTGHGIIWDMWHGTELHPEVFGVSLKQLINCRFAMMGWSVAVVAFACKQKQHYGFLSNSMLVSCVLQLIYIFKFFLWEGGYFNSVSNRYSLFIFDSLGFSPLLTDFRWISFMTALASTFSGVARVFFRVYILLHPIS